MSDESDTDILKKENPLLFAALSFALRRLETFGLAALAYYLAHSGEHKDVKWLGDHLNQKQVEIQQIEQHEK
jgi:hypothetical protein